MDYFWMLFNLGFAVETFRQQRYGFTAWFAVLFLLNVVSVAVRP